MVFVGVQVRTMPRKAMDEVHQHPAIQIFQLKLLRKKAATDTADAPALVPAGITDQPAVPGPAPAGDDNGNGSAVAGTTCTPPAAGFSPADKGPSGCSTTSSVSSSGQAGNSALKAVTECRTQRNQPFRDVEGEALASSTTAVERGTDRHSGHEDSNTSTGRTAEAANVRKLRADFDHPNKSSAAKTGRRRVSDEVHQVMSDIGDIQLKD